MSQLNFYVPRELEQRIRQAAKTRRQTISRFLAQLVSDHFLGAAGPSSKAGYFSKFYGTWQGSVPEIPRSKSTPRDDL